MVLTLQSKGSFSYTRTLGRVQQRHQCWEMIEITNICFMSLSLKSTPTLSFLEKDIPYSFLNGFACRLRCHIYAPLVLTFEPCNNMRKEWRSRKYLLISSRKFFTDVPSKFEQKAHLCRQYSCWSLGCSLLQLHLNSRLNTWLQWIGQRQLQDQDKKHFSFGIWCALCLRFDGKCIGWNEHNLCVQVCISEVLYWKLVVQ